MFLVTACSEKVLFMVKTKVKSDWNTSLFVLFIMRKPQVTNLSLSRHPTLCDSREGMYNRYCCFYGERTKKLKRLWPCEWLKILVRPSLTKTWPVGWKTWITRHGLGSWFFPCLRASGCKILKQKYRRDSKFCASPSPPPPLSILSFPKSYLHMRLCSGNPLSKWRRRLFNVRVYGIHWFQINS